MNKDRAKVGDKDRAKFCDKKHAKVDSKIMPKYAANTEKHEKKLPGEGAIS